MQRTAIIIGAGPAGLTAAYELLTRSDIKPIVLEKSTYMGGISRTVNYKGNRIDIGGHRFFSKSDRVMDWWLQHMPLDDPSAAGKTIAYHNRTRQLSPDAPAQANGDAVMLLRSRKSRIYFLRKFFEYPITLSAQTLRNLGLLRTVKIGFSYLRVALFPPRQIVNLEDFFISRFGRELYHTFFKSYTEKVWGVPCEQISAEWGAQRIKGLSITKTLLHMARKLFASKSDIKQKETETSLIEQFMYPKLGPGQLWEVVAEKVLAMGGEIVTEVNVERLRTEGNRLVAVAARNNNGESREYRGDYFFSTMPVKELVDAVDAPVPQNVREVSDGLIYRDFITVGLLVSKLTVQDPTAANGLVRDNWIYIQEPDVLAGRLQIFNNWSPYMVRDPNTVWIGVEYFCYKTDEMWRLPDAEMAALARQELEKIGILRQADVLDATVLRMEKTYPAYFGSYDRFDEIRSYVDGFENLFLVGRNGMHKYNNQDHSMLTAMTAVDNIIAGVTDKSNIWAVNTEMEYHEEKDQAEQQQAGVSAAPTESPAA
ncbi:MAG TPA: NAD(P)/FAD-dependent oxidoreductase [Clostridia bacterium]|nr:NAD(P)/FAD-dependent oxidoreductase [Clostridia bacterium]